MFHMTPTPARFTQTKAKKYRLDNGRIRPDSLDVLRVEVDNDLLLKDYLELMQGYVCDAPTILECGQYLPITNSAKMRKYKKETTDISRYLLDFCNKWGLFEIMVDRAFFIESTYLDGEIAGYGRPVSALVYDDPHDPLGGDAVVYPFEIYAKGFYTDGVIPGSESEAIQKYSEAVMDILVDPRFRAVANHIKHSGDMAMPAERITLLIDPDGSARPGATSLNQYCQVLYLLNHMKGQDKTREVCHYCKKPFLTGASSSGRRYRQYCSDECMRNERSRQYRLRKKEGKQNAQQARKP